MKNEVSLLGIETYFVGIADVHLVNINDLEEFKLYSTVNTECAEQAFAWLGKFKHAVKYMTHYRFVPLHTV